MAEPLGRGRLVGLSRIEWGNSSASAAAITTVPSKGRLCGAKRDGYTIHSPERGAPDLGGGKKENRAQQPLQRCNYGNHLTIW